MYKNFAEIECVFSDSNIDIVCFCETWLNGNIHDGIIDIPGYDIVRLDRTSKRKGGGLCVYLLDKLKYDSQKYSSLNVSNADFEILVVSINLHYCSPIILIVCYRTPSGNVDTALNCLSNSIECINDDCEFFILGDFNLDYAKSKSPSITYCTVLTEK